MYLIPYPSHVRQNISGALYFAAPSRGPLVNKNYF